MSPSEVARVFRARRSGKGKWMAKCVVHQDRMASLSITDMGNGNTRVHCFGGCSQLDVLEAAGLTWRDLRPGEVAPAIREQMSWHDQSEALERQLGLIAVLQAIDGKPAYWQAAERRAAGELELLRCRMEPEKVLQEYRGRMARELGFEVAWREVK